MRLATCVRITISTLLLLVSANVLPACTNILVTKGASADGSTMITYACDGRFHPHLRRSDAKDNEPGTELEIREWGGKLRGAIPEAEHTYAVVGLMNEHQLTISETTTTGREELQNPEGLIHYWDLMKLALKRARTAREAIEVMTSLVDEFGYRSTAESFSIADPDEVWLMEMIGKGPGRKGAIWVARRIPDGFISAYANGIRIRQFPMDDPENCLFAPDVVDFAVEMGFWKADDKRPFSFAEAYDNPTVQSRRYTASRVWSVFRRAAPSLESSLDPAYHRGDPRAKPYPLWIKPDQKLSTAGVMALMRDHYEGTPWDMTQGLDAGPYATPNRWRPMTWEVSGEQHSWERPISTQQTGFSFVSQSRSWLPDAIGGVYWYGLDDTWTTCYVPLYAGITALPESFTVGSLGEFSWDSAWWVFNFVANIANLKFSHMTPEILALQQEIEGEFFTMQPVIEKAALELMGTDPDLALRFLTDYSVNRAESVVIRWKALGEHLLMKYNDGYINEKGTEPERGYPDSWLEEVVRSRPEQFHLDQNQEPEIVLPY
ncbi:MAG: C69 family dipeptidase [Acidobacteriota bacterium]